MKRLWLGIGLLGLLLILGLLLQAAVSGIYVPLSNTLEQASEAALEENWQQASLWADNAARQWEKHRRITAAFADHTPMDEVDMLFAEMRVYERERDGAHFAACCNQLAEMARAIADAHSLSWWNLL